MLISIFISLGRSVLMFLTVDCGTQNTFGVNVLCATVHGILIVF